MRPYYGVARIFALARAQIRRPFHFPSTSESLRLDIIASGCAVFSNSALASNGLIFCASEGHSLGTSNQVLVSAELHTLTSCPKPSFMHIRIQGDGLLLKI